VQNGSAADLDALPAPPKPPQRPFPAGLPRASRTGVRICVRCRVRLQVIPTQAIFVAGSGGHHWAWI